MTVEALARLVPPPAQPQCADADWPAVEATIGLRLPDDYKQLVIRYGAGKFCGLIRPLTIAGACTLMGFGRDMIAIQQDLAHDGFPYSFHPAPGGLLPWGTTSDGHLLCWLTDGDWPVVVLRRRDQEFERHDTTAVDFLHGWLAGTVSSELLPNVAPTQWFDQLRELRHLMFRLSETDVPHPEQVRLLTAAFAPVVPRRDDDIAVMFDVADWRVRYEAGPFQLRIDFPPSDTERAMAAVRRAAAAMGREIVATHDDGTGAWG